MSYLYLPRGIQTGGRPGRSPQHRVFTLFQLCYELPEKSASLCWRLNSFSYSSVSRSLRIKRMVEQSHTDFMDICIIFSVKK